MYKKETFQMTYSADEQEEIQAIRKKYVTQKEDKMEQLRSLDAKATGTATARSIAIGVLGTLVLGLGMSLIMSDFGNLLGTLAFPVGIGAGIIGMIILGCAYPLYTKTLKKERAKIAPEIIRLTDELMK